MMKNNLDENGGVGIAVIITMIITTVLVGGGVYVWQTQSQKVLSLGLQKQVLDLRQQVNNLQQQVGQTGNNTVGQDMSFEQSVNKVNNNIVKTDDFKNDDWKLYINKEYGYSIKYPKNWLLKEMSEPALFDESIQVKNIILRSANSDDYYMLQLGIKKSEERDVVLSNRTGVGAGVMEKGKMALGKYSVEVGLLKNSTTNKIIDIVGKEVPIDNKYMALINFSYFGTNSTGDTNFDITKAKEYKIAKEILSTFKFNN